MFRLWERPARAVRARSRALRRASSACCFIQPCAISWSSSDSSSTCSRTPHAPTFTRTACDQEKARDVQDSGARPGKPSSCAPQYERRLTLRHAGARNPRDRRKRYPKQGRHLGFASVIVFTRSQRFGVAGAVQISRRQSLSHQRHSPVVTGTRVALGTCAA